jgi:excisionase family DNA binding protein
MPDGRRLASEPVVPTDEEARLAREASRRLSRLGALGEVRLRAKGARGGEASIVLPPAAARVVHELLRRLADGDAVAVMPMAAELTTQQAADVLNVSRPYLVKLLEAGRLPHRKVGRHRRVRAGDVLALRRRMEAERRAALEKLVEEGQELDLGY